MQKKLDIIQELLKFTTLDVNVKDEVQRDIQIVQKSQCKAIVKIVKIAGALSFE